MTERLSETKTAKRGRPPAPHPRIARAGSVRARVAPYSETEIRAGVRTGFSFVEHELPAGDDLLHGRKYGRKMMKQNENPTMSGALRAYHVDLQSLRPSVSAEA